MRPSIIVAPTYYTVGAPSYYVESKCYTEAPVYYTITYATPLLHRISKVLHREVLILHHHICCLSSIYRGIQVLLCSQLPPNRGSCLLHHQGTPVLYCSIRCSDLLHRSITLPQVSTPARHLILHHNIRFFTLLQGGS